MQRAAPRQLEQGAVGLSMTPGHEDFMTEQLAALAKAHLPVARPTDNLSDVVDFFEDPDGYRAMLQNARWP